MTYLEKFLYQITHKAEYQEELEDMVDGVPKKFKNALYSGEFSTVFQECEGVGMMLCHRAEAKDCAISQVLTKIDLFNDELNINANRTNRTKLSGVNLLKLRVAEAFVHMPEEWIYDNSINVSARLFNKIISILEKQVTTTVSPTTLWKYRNFFVMKLFEKNSLEVIRDYNKDTDNYKETLEGNYKRLINLIDNEKCAENVRKVFIEDPYIKNKIGEGMYQNFCALFKLRCTELSKSLWHQFNQKREEKNLRPPYNEPSTFVEYFLPKDDFKKFVSKWN